MCIRYINKYIYDSRESYSISLRLSPCDLRFSYILVHDKSVVFPKAQVKHEFYK